MSGSASLVPMLQIAPFGAGLAPELGRALGAVDASLLSVLPIPTAALPAPAPVPETPGAADALSQSAAEIGAASASEGDAGVEQAARKSFDGAGGVAALNGAVRDVLAPFNNQLTKAEVVFNKVQTNETRAVDLDLTVDYRKTGAYDNLALTVNPLSYSYPETAGAQPAVKAGASLAMNFGRIIPQAQFNELGSAADQIVAQFLAGKAAEYGDAARVNAQVTRRDVDSAGNLTGVALEIGADLDLSKLPQGKDPADELVTSFKLAVEVTLKSIGIQVNVGFNPQAKEFVSEGKGLKEGIEKLLARDPQTIQEIRSFIQSVDSFANQVINSPNPLGGLFGGLFN